MARAKSGTLTEDVVTTVDIDTGYPDGVEVVNRTGTGAIWVRLDRTNPTVAGDDCFPVMTTRRFEMPEGVTAALPVQVRLISAAATAYTVAGAASWKRA